MSTRQSIVMQWLRARLPVSQEELLRRADFIDAYAFPAELKERFAEEHPQWDYHQCEAVWKGLKEYFHLCRLAGTSFVSMPSTAADEAWHEFILWTREYDYFCQNAFGRFLHHTPAARAGGTVMNEGYWRAWRLACTRNKLNAHTTVTLPALFALDAELGLASMPNPKDLARGYRGSTALTSSCGSSSSSSSSCGGSPARHGNFNNANDNQSHVWFSLGGHNQIADSSGHGHGHGHGSHDAGSTGGPDSGCTDTGGGADSAGSSDSGGCSDSGGGGDSGGGSSCGGASSCGGGGSSCGGGGGCGGSS